MIVLFEKTELYFGKNYFCIISQASSRNPDPGTLPYCLIRSRTIRRDQLAMDNWAREQMDARQVGSKIILYDT